MQSIFKRGRSYLMSCLLLLGLSGCSTLSGLSEGPAGSVAVTGIAVAAPPTAEGQLLASLDGAATGTDILLPGGVRAVADEAYAAASGRTCRRARLGYPDGRLVHRLACEFDGHWQWVPAVTLHLNG